MDVTNGGKLLLVTSRWARKLTIIDTESRKVVRQVNVGKSPHGVWTLDHARALSRRRFAAAPWRCCWPWRRAGARAQDLRQAGLPDAGHRPHGRGAADRGGAQRQQVKVTFFAANERPGRRRQPGRALGALVEGAGRRGPRVRLAHLRPRLLARRPARRPAALPHAAVGRAGGRPRPGTGRPRSTAPSCRASADGWRKSRASKPLPLFRAPGGKTSPRCCKPRAPAATSTWAGRRPASWATSFPANRPNAELLAEGAARRAQRRHPAGPPGHLVAQGPLGAGRAGAADHGPEGRGFCFATLREHPPTAELDRAR
jgi:YVTN family beta-propeller protein